MNDARTVTVDGPAGSGKSTLGRALALALDLPLIDTGLFYRGVTVAAVRAGIDATDTAALGELAARTSLLIDTDARHGSDSVVVDGVPAGAALHDPRNADLLGTVASLPAVRAAVLDKQRAPAADGAVAVGRDCGTVVFPHARVKFYLDAPPEVRESRRLAQLRARGADADGTTMFAEVRDRDRRDTGRAVSPLRRAEDAVVIDTALVGRSEMIALALATCAAAGLEPADSR